MNRFEFDSNRRGSEKCPCGKGNRDGKFSTFKGYIDKGHCFGCGETFFPDSTAKERTIAERKTIQSIAPTSYISQEVMKQSQGKYDENTLLVFLSKLTNPGTAAKIRSDYFIGTSMFWKGSTVFWQIDVEGKIRGGKIIQYAMRQDEMCSIGINCSRVKSNVPPVKWVSKLIKEKDFNLNQCFFGEHLLKMFPDRKVGILESEKSALIATAYHPDVVWLACGGVGGLSNEKIRVLEGRSVTLFPDLGKIEQWKEKATIMSKELRKAVINVSDFLERNATEEEKINGLDLADFLIRKEWSNYGK